MARPLTKREAVHMLARVCQSGKLRAADARKFGQACAALSLDTTDTVQEAIAAEYGGMLLEVRAGWYREYSRRQSAMRAAVR